MAGYVYIAKNKILPGLVKIGQTENIQERLKGLNSSTSIPECFEMIYYVKVPNYILLEKDIHKKFEKERVNLNKEFFRINEDVAKNSLDKMSKCEVYHQQDIIKADAITIKDTDFMKFPAVLTKDELLHLSEKSDGILRITINRWIKKGVLKKAGERSGVYYNLVADPHWENHVLTAVEKKFPSAILAGPSVLHAHGLQTQIPEYFFVAVLRQRTFPQMDKVQWMPRSKRWFAEFIPSDTLYGMRSLSPEQALRDGLKHQHQANAWVPDMDDIDMDELEALKNPSSPKRKKGF